MTRTHKESSEIHGPNFETRVYEMLLADDRFRRVRRATRDEQREEHFDIYAETFTKVILKIECKSIKDNDDALAIVEGRTVWDKNKKTHPGWLFGTSTHIAFERADGQITWVTTPALKRYVESKQIDWYVVPLTKKITG